MFEALLVVTAVIAIIGILVALDASRDVFHPLIFIGPMMVFLYSWMPFKLWSSDGLDRYFDASQLIFVQRINILGVLAFVGACLWAGVRLPRNREISMIALSPEACRRLLIAGAIVGTIGAGCW